MGSGSSASDFALNRLRRNKKEYNLKVPENGKGERIGFLAQKELIRPNDLFVEMKTGRVALKTI